MALELCSQLQSGEGTEKGSWGLLARPGRVWEWTIPKVCTATPSSLAQTWGPKGQAGQRPDSCSQQWRPLSSGPGAPPALLG